MADIETPASSILIDGIHQPGRTLAFCDETDLTTAPTTTMIGRIHAWVGMVMPSEGYGALQDAVLTYQSEQDVYEFHGTEMVNPTSRSPWKAIPMGERLQAFRFACELVARHASSLLYVHIAEEQYAQMRERDDRLPACHKAAVKTVFRRHIVDRLRDHVPAILILDKDKNDPAPTLQPVERADHLVGGGILRSPSHSVAGIQMADVAAYAIGRYIKRRDKIITKTANGFDDIAMEMVAAMNGRVRSLLN